MNFDYLKPPASVNAIKHAHDYIYKGDGKKAIRRIFSNVEYTPFENSFLSKLYQHFEDEDIEIPAAWTQGDSLKFAYAGNFELTGKDGGVVGRLEKRFVLERIMAAAPLPLESQTILKKGWIYLGGVDKQHRPILVFNLASLDMKTTTVEECFDALNYLFYQIQKYMFVPGLVENVVLFLDTANQGPHQINHAFLQKVLTGIGDNYPESIDKICFLNVSKAIKLAWFAIKNIVPEKNRQMITLLTTDDLKNLSTFIDQRQIEKKYGGTKPDFKNEEDFWPPANPFPPAEQPRSLVFNQTASNRKLSGRAGTPTNLHPRGASPLQSTYLTVPNQHLIGPKLGDTAHSPKRTTLKSESDIPTGETQNSSGKGFFTRFFGRGDTGHETRETPIVFRDSGFFKDISPPKPKKEKKITHYKLDKTQTYDLDDTELLFVVQRENNAFIRDRVPDDEDIEISIAIRERVKAHSSKPFSASNRGAQRSSFSPVRAAYGGGIISERPSIHERMSTGGGKNPSLSSLSIGAVSVKRERDEIPSWVYKKPKTEWEEDYEEDDRGGIFCGICTSYKPAFIGTGTPPERKPLRQKP